MCETEFKNSLREFGLDISDRQLQMFETYYQQLTKTNKVMNLTAITEKRDVYSLHFLDSLSLIYAAREADIELPLRKRLIDVGTGAGFPGLPLKIMMPDMKLTLLDSLNKRLNFLSSVISTEKIEGVELIHARAEDGAKDPKLREKFDVAVSRAVAALPVLAEYCLPYVKIGGYFAAYKTAAADEEIKSSEKALKVLGGQVISTNKFTLPGTDVQRSIIFIRKCSKTPKAYPRKAGTPKNNPL